MLALRVEFEGGAEHRRSPESAAELLYGFDTFLAFATEVGAIDVSESERFRTRCISALKTGTRNQAAEMRDADPVQRFLSGLSQTLAANKGHFESITGACPAEGHRFGWSPDPPFGDMKPAGTMLGIVDGPDLYVLPTLAVAEVRKLFESAGSTWHMTTNALGRALLEQHVIVESGRDNKPTIHKSLNGQRVTWWHIGTKSIEGGDDSEPDVREGANRSGENRFAGASANGAQILVTTNAVAMGQAGDGIGTDNRCGRVVFSQIDSDTKGPLTSTLVPR